MGLVTKRLHRWLEPFRVIRQTTAVNYEVQNPDEVNLTYSPCRKNETLLRGLSTPYSSYGVTNGRGPRRNG